MLAVSAVLIGGLLNPACSENNGKGSGSSKQKSNDKRMVLSTGEYNKGYQDGKRDAAASLIDANGSWMWDWMKEPEYRQGYNQGWKDGRQIKKLQAKAETAKQEAKQQAPQKEKQQSSRANLRPLHKAKTTVTVDSRSKEHQ